MTHEPGREAHTTHLCEHCGRQGPLTHNERHDEYWCGDCLDNEVEAAWERQQARDLESPPESAREEQLRTWAEHKEAHKR